MTATTNTERLCTKPFRVKSRKERDRQSKHKTTQTTRENIAKKKQKTGDTQRGRWRKTTNHSFGATKHTTKRKPTCNKVGHSNWILANRRTNLNDDLRTSYEDKRVRRQPPPEQKSDFKSHQHNPLKFKETLDPMNNPPTQPKLMNKYKRTNENEK